MEVDFYSSVRTKYIELCEKFSQWKKYNSTENMGFFVTLSLAATEVFCE